MTFPLFSRKMNSHLFYPSPDCTVSSETFQQGYTNIKHRVAERKVNQNTLRAIFFMYTNPFTLCHPHPTKRNNVTHFIALYMPCSAPSFGGTVPPF